MKVSLIDFFLQLMCPDFNNIYILTIEINDLLALFSFEFEPKWSREIHLWLLLRIKYLSTPIALNVW